MSTTPSALARVVPLLRCPHCGRGLEGVDSGVRCGADHSFDRARQGQLSLFGPRGRRFPGDTADQVAARERVQRSGLFTPLADELARTAAAHLCDRAGAVDRPPVVLEAGAGTGYYLRAVVAALRSGASPVTGIGTEISAAAARRLARADEDVAALVADTWEPLPLADGCADLLQVVFAPRNAAEFARVLRPGGLLVVAVPGQGHLEPLRSRVGMLEPAPDKVDRLGSGVAGHFRVGEVHRVDTAVTVPGELAVDLALMGPSGVHLERTAVEDVLGQGELRVRVHVEVRTYLPLREA